MMWWEMMEIMTEKLLRKDSLGEMKEGMGESGGEWKRKTYQWHRPRGLFLG